MTESGGGDWARFGVRLLRLALRSHPPARRAEYGREIELDFVELVSRRQRSVGRPSAVCLALGILVDTVASGWSLRRNETPQLGAALRARGKRRSEMRVTPVESWIADVRDATRSLRRAPAVSAATVLILALGIGANVAVWSVLRSTLMATVDAPEPQRLVVPRITMREAPSGEPEMFPWSYPKFQVLRQFPDRLVEPVAGYATRAVTLRGEGEASRVDLQIVDPELFEILGVQPALGSLFTRAAVESSPRVALVSHSLWASRYGGDPAVIGRTILVNDQPLEVVGVLPRGFRGLGGEDGLWAPFQAAPELFNPRQLTYEHAHWFHAIGRLVEGADLAAAREQMQVIGRAVAEAYPDEGTAIMGADLFRLDDVRRNPAAETAVVLLACATAMVLLIACANLATLFLSRGMERARAASIRRALGASRWRIVRGALVESWLLAGLGALAGLGVAVLGSRALASLWPDRFVMGDASLRYSEIAPHELDLGTLLVTLGLATLCSLLFGALPAFRLAGRARLQALGESGVAAQAAAPGSRLGLRGALVAGQVALTLVLLASTALLLQSLLRLSEVGTGIDAPEQVLTARYEIPRSSPAAQDSASFHAELIDELEALPGVTSASVGSASPFAGHDWITGVRRIDARPDFSDNERPTIGVASVSDGFFRTLGIETLAGRTFDSRDRADSRPVIVLSRSAALELYGDPSPVGRQMALGIGLTPSGSDAMAEVIGVVEDVLYDRPDEGVASDSYVSNRQEPLRYGVALVRTTLEPLELTSSMRGALARLDPGIPLFGVATLENLRGRGMGDTRVLGSLLAVLAAIALTLAAVGTYGTMTCWVDGRGRELGLRLALGARSRQVLGLVLGRGMLLLAIGAAVGAAATFGVGRALDGLLFGVGSRDPISLALAVGLLVAVGAAACWLPAARAGRTDPSSVLRGD